MSDMVIGYDAKRAFCNRTGLGNYSRGVIAGVLRAARDKGTRAMLYTPRTDPAFANYFDDVPQAEVRMPQGLWRCMPNLWRSLAPAQHVHLADVQLYHGLSHELPLFLPADVRKVVTMHDLIVRRYPHYFSLFDRIVHRIKQRHACRVADIVLAISEQTKRDLIDLMHVPEEKIRVLYQSCEPQFWQPVNDAQVDAVREKYGLPRRYIVSIGTVEERKNQFCAIEAMKHLPDDVALIIVGRPRGAYGRRVAVAADGRRVRLLSGVAFADFPALYAGAVASVYMSRFEGFGIPVLESLCCDCPVVTSNVSSMPEAGGDAALYATPDDHAVVAAHLLHLLDDDAFRQECIKKGRTWRIRFSPEVLAQQMLEHYKELLHN